MTNEPRQRWKVSRLRVRAGQYFNSPVIEQWAECGVIVAPDEDAAANRAREIVGPGVAAVRVEPVSEFYQPETLQ